jgi:tryptophan-rich sensory protein
MAKEKEKLPIYLVLLTYLISVFWTKIDDWYVNIAPAYTPSEWAFTLVWVGLYILFAWSFYIVYNKKKTASTPYFVSLIAQVSWIYFFFQLHAPLYSFVVIQIVKLMALVMFFEARKVDKKAAYAIVPYIIWVYFAGILNADMAGLLSWIQT